MEFKLELEVELEFELKRFDIVVFVEGSPVWGALVVCVVFVVCGVWDINCALELELELELELDWYWDWDWDCDWFISVEW